MHEGETPEDALAPGTARRRALDAALAEIDAGRGASRPSSGAASARCCSASSACSPRRSRTSPTGPLNPPSGRRALGHADRAARRGAAQRQRRNGAASPRRVDPRRGWPDGEPDDEESRSTRRSMPDEDEAASTGRDERRGRRGRTARRAARGPQRRTSASGSSTRPAPARPSPRMGFVEASRTGGVLILTHRRNLVDQFLGELRDRGYAKRDLPGAARRRQDRADGPVTVETYQWFVRNAGNDLRRLHDRHLRRGAHRAGREDERRDPRAGRARSSSA